MSVEENKDLVSRIIKESADAVGDVNKLNALVDKYYAPDAVTHFASGGDVNLEQYKQLMPYMWNAFPDANTIVDDMVAEGDKVVVRYTMEGTQKGEYLGVAPTGKKITMNIVVIVRIAGGKAAEGWVLGDTFGLMIQLGAIPNPYVQR